MSFTQSLSPRDAPGDSPRDGSTAELALGLATEAMKSAAVAMSKATEALSQKESKPPLVPHTGEPRASTFQTLNEEEEEDISLAELPAAFFPPRSSSIPRNLPSTSSSPIPRIRNTLRHITTSAPASKSSSLAPAQKEPFRPGLPPPAPPPATKANALAHIDLIDAVSALNAPFHDPPLSSYPENPSIPLVLSDNHKSHRKPNYEEAVADRNMNGFWPLTFTYPLSSSRSASRLSSAVDSAILVSHTTTITSATTKPPSPFRTKAHEIAFILSLLCSNLLTQAALAQSIAPMPLIGTSFHDMNEKNWSWYAAAYCLTIGAFILPAGRLGSVYGHKKVYVAGWIWFGVFSALAGFAPMVQSASHQTPALNPSLATMLGAEVFFCWSRAMQGIGPALLLPNALALLTHVFKHAPSNKRNIIYAMFGATAPTGLVLGGVFSGLISERMGWPSAFWVMGGVCFLMAGVSFAVIDGSSGRLADRRSRLGYDVEVEVGRDDRVGWVERWMELDGNGAFLGMAALVLLGFAWNQAPLVGWQTPYTYFTLILGLVLLIAFLINEFLAPHALLPLPYLTLATLTPLLCTFLAWSSFATYLFYTYAFLFLRATATPTPSLPPSILFVPVALSGILAVASTSLSFARLGPRPLLVASLLFVTAANLLLALARLDQSYWQQIFVAMFLLPWAMDMSFPSAVVLVGDGMGAAARAAAKGCPRGRSNAGDTEESERMVRAAIRDPGTGTEASTLVMGTIMVGMAVGLGVAGTVARQVGSRAPLPPAPADVVAVFRCVFWLGVALGGLGCVVAGASFVVERARAGGRRRRRRPSVKTDMS